ASLAVALLLIGCNDNKTDDLAQRVTRLEASAGATGDLQKRITALEEATKQTSIGDAQKKAEGAKKEDEDARTLRGKKVTIPENQAGAEAVAAERLECFGVSSIEAVDSNNKTCGYFVPDCFTRVVKSQCPVAGGMTTPYTFTPGKYALITSPQKRAKEAISS